LRDKKEKDGKRAYQKDTRQKSRLKHGVFKKFEKIFRRLYQEAYRTVSAAAIMIKNGKAMVFREKGGADKTKTQPKNHEPVHHTVSIVA
jgi:hypothetical protein